MKMRGETPEGVSMAGPNAGKSPVLDAATEYFARPVLRAAKDVVAGAVGASDIVGNPLRDLTARGLDAVGLNDLATTATNTNATATTEKAIDSATGGLTAPRNPHDKISDAVGEMITPVPGAAAQIAKGAHAAKQAAAIAPKAKTADELKQLYKDGREALSQVNLPGDQVQAGLVQPVLDALKSENPARYGPVVQSTIQELKDFGKSGVNANFLESFRQDLGQLPSKFAQPIRDAIDNFYEGAGLPDVFRSAYAVMKRGETLTNALTKAGDSLTKQRNAINAFAVKYGGNLTDAEKNALDAAGKASTSEALLKVVGSTLKPFGYFGSILNLPAGLTTAASGEGLKMLAGKLGQNRIEKAVQAVKGRSLEDIAK